MAADQVCNTAAESQPVTRGPGRHLYLTLSVTVHVATGLRETETGASHRSPLHGPGGSFLTPARSVEARGHQAALQFPPGRQGTAGLQGGGRGRAGGPEKEGLGVMYVRVRECTYVGDMRVDVCACTCVGVCRRVRVCILAFPLEEQI